MSVRTNKLRKMRKNVMRMATRIEEVVLNRDDDGTLWPKKDRGVSVHAIVNGWSIAAPDKTWYEAYKGCLECAKWAMTQPEGNNK